MPYNVPSLSNSQVWGFPLSWHQDGVTLGILQWEEGIHGFNFGFGLCDTSAMSCLWVAPGSHKVRKIDIKVINGSKQRKERSRCMRRLATSPSSAAKRCMLFRECRTARLTDVWIHKLRAGCRRRSAIDQCCVRRRRNDERSEVIGVAIDARAQFCREETLPLSSNGGPRVGNLRSILQTGKKSSRITM